jgi:hypothetical protein
MNKSIAHGVCAAVIVATLSFASASFAEDNVVVAKDAKDVIAFGGRIVVKDSKSKLLGGAAGEIETSNASFENVVIAGGSINMQDGNAGDVRAAGGKIDMGMNVTGNLNLAAGDLILNDTMKVGGNTEIHGGNVDVLGAYAGNVDIDGDKVTVGGKIGGNLTIQARNAALAPGTVIGGNLKVPDGTEIPDDVVIGGKRKVSNAKKPDTNGVEIQIDLDDEAADKADAKKAVADAIKSAAVKHSSRSTDDESAGLISPSPMGMESWLTVLVTLAACGALALGIAPQFVARAAERLAKEPLPSLGVGAASIVAVPLVLAAICITIIGIPFALLGAAAYAIGIGLGLIALCLWGGLMVRTLANQPGQETRVAKLVGWTLMGFLALALIGAVPLVGRLIQILAITSGAGAVLSTGWAMRNKTSSISAV